MSRLIAAGRDAELGLPRDRLSEEEMAELRRLLAARDSLQVQAALLNQRIELFVLAVRDARGLAGRIGVDPETGTVAEQPPGEPR